MQQGWLKFLQFFIQMTIPVCFYINYTKETICYSKILVCFVLKASSWLLASKVTFYFVLAPFSARCKLVIWLLCGEFLLKLCPLRHWAAQHVSQGPGRRHRSPVLLPSGSPAPSEPSRKAGQTGPGISAWHKPRRQLPFLRWTVPYQPFCALPGEVRAWGQALALPSPQVLPQLQVGVTNP